MIELPDVPDPVFSSKEVMGEGFGIKPLIGEVLAPADAEVVMVAETQHAVAFKMDSGLGFSCTWGSTRWSSKAVLSISM